MTVPLRIENTTLLGLNADEIVSLCYELHGEDDAYFNLVSDGCVSVNAHYITITPDLDINIIDAITVRAVDVNGSCQNIAVDLQGCTLSINGVTMDQYSSGGITVRRYNNRIRISVPNCADQDLVMWVMCLNGTLQHPETSEYFTAEMIRFVIARGFSLNEKSHGILGELCIVMICIVMICMPVATVIDQRTLLPAGRVQSVRTAGPKIALRFLHLSVHLSVRPHLSHAPYYTCC